MKRRSAADDLRWSEAPAALDALQEALLGDRWEQVRAKAAESLGAMRAREAAEALRRALRTDQAPEVRTAAVFALGKIVQPSVAPDICDRLRHDPAHEVRMAAARVLGSVGGAVAAETLCEALFHKGGRHSLSEERVVITESLRQIGLPAVEEPLLANVGSRDYFAAVAAVSLLCELGLRDERFWRALVAALGKVVGWKDGGDVLMRRILLALAEIHADVAYLPIPANDPGLGDASLPRPSGPPQALADGLPRPADG